MTTAATTTTTVPTTTQLPTKSLQFVEILKEEARQTRAAFSALVVSYSTWRYSPSNFHISSD